MLQEIINKICHYNEEISLSADDHICQSCTHHYTLQKNVPDDISSQLPGTLHEDNCSYCGKSLLLKSGLMNETLDATTGEIEESVIAPEYLEHRHLTSSRGNITSDKNSFVRFALRCRHKKHNNRITLGSCICQACYIVLWKKYNAGKEGLIYTPKVRSKFKSAQKCEIKHCEDNSYLNLEIVPDLFLAEFEVKECQSNQTSFNLCKNHRRLYRRKAFEISRCFICTKILRKTKIQTINKNEKEKFVNLTSVCKRK